jgi:outer membrane murein-binding lipoprotein Lpp
VPKGPNLRCLNAQLDDLHSDFSGIASDFAAIRASTEKISSDLIAARRDASRNDQKFDALERIFDEGFNRLFETYQENMRRCVSGPSMDDFPPKKLG